MDSIQELINFLGSKEQNFKVTEHEILSKSKEGVLLKIKCQNGAEFVVQPSGEYQGKYIDQLFGEVSDLVYNKIEDLLDDQIQDILDDTVSKEEVDKDITFQFYDSEMKYSIKAIGSDGQEQGIVEGYLIPDAVDATSYVFSLMDNISHGCYQIYTEIYGKRKKISPCLRKHMKVNTDLVVIDNLKVQPDCRGKKLGTKLMQKFLDEYCKDMVVVLLAVNDEDQEGVFEQKLYSFYESFGFLEIKKNSPVFYRPLSTTR
jgi:ribosomal protein S18 acetylase RimI-like enzyme